MGFTAYFIYGTSLGALSMATTTTSYLALFCISSCFAVYTAVTYYLTVLSVSFTFFTGDFAYTWAFLGVFLDISVFLLYGATGLAIFAVYTGFLIFSVFLIEFVWLDGEY